MNDKPMAGIVTFVIAAPLMLLCCLAPFLLVSSAAGLLSWLAGGSIILGAMVAAAAGALVFLAHRHRRQRAGGIEKAGHADSAGMASQRPGQTRRQSTAPSKLFDPERSNQRLNL
jgi:HAMP domain-containing protein